jgi:MoxR-like ATPase
MLQDAIAYLRRSNGMDYPRPLLVVGAKGSGKTSLVKLIAERLESDREVLPGLPSRLHYVIR